jgi:hypothetical protein
VEVSSYWLEDSGVLIDPLVPMAEGLEWCAQRPVAPTAILLSNRHHYRESERFDCAVYCNKQGLHEFSDSQPVAGFELGEHAREQLQELVESGGRTAFEM